ncbi:MAG: hypothetical protein DWQ34_11710 [Planctomycetota bacterium]|nr:MAG: hypothetical protein DWQ29_07760 [Planctomycetota bacterium]REJ93126.1 MAG: hypothetical protein DWQ34_11710 [Planctomycetota bacterium]REK30115.1 MAG: hypothetical protein DWQ41_03015 [Planctomycetota bacterium]REK37642.1 MAG: hypothetical protein DWQ45_06510 [Planctomycetota bacterium]
MSLAKTAFFELTEAESYTEEFYMFVKHRERWIQTVVYSSIQEAETMAELAHHRSGLPTEVRAADGAVLLAFDPPG